MNYRKNLSLAKTPRCGTFEVQGIKPTSAAALRMDALSSSAVAAAFLMALSTVLTLAWPSFLAATISSPEA